MQREKERNVKFNYLINLRSFSDADLENDPIQFQQRRRRRSRARGKVGVSWKQNVVVGGCVIWKKCGFVRLREKERDGG